MLLIPFCYCLTSSRDYQLSSMLSVFFWVTMAKYHKIKLNCDWHVPHEWLGLNYYSGRLTNLYWKYISNIVRVCVKPFHPTNSKLNLLRISKTQIHVGSKAMASLLELICHHSLKFSDPLLGKLLSYLSTHFPMHIFDYSVFKSSVTDSVSSIDSSISAFFFDGSTFFSQISKFTIFLNSSFVCNPKVFTKRQALHGMKKDCRRLKGPQRPAARAHPQALTLQKSAVVDERLQLFLSFCKRLDREQPEPLPAHKTGHYVITCKVGLSMRTSTSGWVILNGIVQESFQFLGNLRFLQAQTLNTPETLCIHRPLLKFCKIIGQV